MYRCILSVVCIVIIGCANNEDGNNLKKVNVGMDIQEVNKIMGPPDSVMVFPEEKDQFRYVYIAPIGMSGNYYIIFSKADSTVALIDYGI